MKISLSKVKTLRTYRKCDLFALYGFNRAPPRAFCPTPLAFLALCLAPLAIRLCMYSNNHILLTIDVEDWFQVENFKPWIPFSTWDQRELRVEKNVNRLLDLFDSIELNTQRNALNQPNQPIQPSTSTNQQSAKQTYLIQLSFPQRPSFNKAIQQNVSPQSNVLRSRLARRSSPQIIHEIQSRGHEIASHGCNHELPELLSADELKQDLTGSKKLLEDITGAEVAGYRAPSFAINDDILKIIEDAGYLYDSSYNSFSLHGRYGKISLNGPEKKALPTNYQTISTNSPLAI